MSEWYCECQECGWQGDESELECSEEDSKTFGSGKEINFNLCPDCKSSDIDEIDENE